jgi:hypothetical protein
MVQIGRILAFLACALLLAGAGAGSAVATRGGTQPRARSSESAEAGQALAAAEAQKLLEDVALPVGAVVSASEPAGDGGSLAVAIPPPRVAEVQEHRWWVVPGTAVSVAAYMREHRPPEAPRRRTVLRGVPATRFWSTETNMAGVALGVSRAPVPAGEAPSGEAGTQHVVVHVSAPSGGVIAETWLYLTVTQLPGGVSGVLARALVLWVPPPVPIPAGARVLRILSEAEAGLRVRRRLHLASRTYVITSPRQIAMVRSLFAALPVQRPTAFAPLCGPPIGGFTTRFQFLASRHATSPMAELRWYTTACGGGVPLYVAGHEVRTLDRFADPDLLCNVERELHLKLERFVRRPEG